MSTNQKNKKWTGLTLFFYAFAIIFTQQIMGDEMATEERTDYSFPPEEYEQYMKLIKEINPKTYARLRKCEEVLGAPCIEEATDIDSMIDEGSDETGGYPIMVIKSMRDFDEIYQKTMLELYVDWYNAMKNKTIIPVTQEERDAVLSTIKSLTPELYELIVAVDPTGEEHIKRSDDIGASVKPGPDGLPLFRIDTLFINEPKGHQLSTMGHEIGHYVIDHFTEAYQISHQALTKEESGPASFNKKGKKVGGQLSFKDAFAKAYNRSKEDEADRFAVIDLGVNIDDAIAEAKNWIIKVKEYEIEHPEKETFLTTHPLWVNRIKHLESLRREVEARGYRKTAPKAIDWQDLIKRYQKKFGK